MTELALYCPNIYDFLSMCLCFDSEYLSIDFRGSSIQSEEAFVMKIRVSEAKSAAKSKDPEKVLILLYLYIKNGSNCVASAACLQNT